MRLLHMSEQMLFKAVPMLNLVSSWPILLQVGVHRNSLCPQVLSDMQSESYFARTKVPSPHHPDFMHEKAEAWKQRWDLSSVTDQVCQSRPSAFYEWWHFKVTSSSLWRMRIPVLSGTLSVCWVGGIYGMKASVFYPLHLGYESGT